MNDYKNYLKLIQKITWSFYKTTGVDWNDLFQEAFFGYLEAKEKYDPKKGKFSSFLWITISSRLKKYLRKEMEFRKIEVVDWELESYSPQISIETTEILNSIAENIGEFINLSKKEITKKIYEVMLKKGWSFTKTKEVLQELWI